ncbi:uncharacterized protein LOC131876288 [Cryptomeria japonica]|uniref:uncharacterized protein LOC131876288 n=1 Tax=Cryptomeria japonica TaxID=3369 RepID=UPI0027DA3096|nr:uncharacterized protein LOC131876288 [Cryptomeria japonica]
MQGGKHTRSFMKKHPRETLQEGLPEQSRRGHKRSVLHESSNAAWVQKNNNMGKISKRHVYARSNSSSRESEHDVFGFHSGLFGNVEDINVLNQVNISNSKEVFPNEDKISQEIEDLNTKVHHLISLRTQKEANKEREVKAKLMERDRLLRQIADLEVLAQEKAKSEDEGLVIREILVPKAKPACNSVTQPNREVFSDPQPIRNEVDKGKHKCMEDESGSKTIVEISHKLLAHEREMERMRKEKEDLQMELEKAELEAANQEVTRKIGYLKAPPIMFPLEGLNKPIPQQVSLPPVKIQPTLPINIETVSQAPIINHNNQISQPQAPNIKMNMGNNNVVNPF